MNDNHNHHLTGTLDLYFIVGFCLLLFIYVHAAVIANHKKRKWPLYRTIFWILGILCAAISLIGPIANRALFDFTFHMVGHLLLGMLSPLLLVLAAPISLMMRALSVTASRRLSRVLRSWPIRLISDPIASSLLNIGGLWILYLTDLYSLMHQNVFLHFIIHIHVFLAGYLFTSSMISFDPNPHKASFTYRTCVLIITLAGHGILSKLIYANPPASVSKVHAEDGAMLMYYGGDIIDLVLIYFLCLEWYKATRPRVTTITT
ncbi:cytochrome c oxidase assembly protein [Metabacillus sp. B2-18]|uniref:cytochrome c oxidase assembly protein n=1 Tax=Metabacillus sp. B2-18 TaxID=2897333 RepID=UPI001E4F3D47|nr:cytochrome c oxidase assembly protein [Metabacillus sp. B2-18]UGB32869.1 cytochrome c oxidase assembly protein [Metabacillus sp. B2-18]